MDDPSHAMNRAFQTWPTPPSWPPLPLVDDPMGFHNHRQVFAASSVGGNPARASWKGKKAADKRKKAAAGGAGGGAAGYKPPVLNDLQSQNRLKARRFFQNKKPARFAPFAPRNTTSYLIRAKKAGGIVSLVSPSPVTPAVLQTPKFSPSREVLVDMAKEEWGVDGYGSMKGRIRLRSPSGYEIRGLGGGGGEEEEAADTEGGSSGSDVEEHLEVDLSRFEMVYPGGEEEQQAAACLLENRVDDQDSHIAHLEEENLMLKGRLFLMEREMGELGRRLLLLETHCREDDNRGENSNNGNVAEASESGGGGGEHVCSSASAGDPAESHAAFPMTG